MAESVLYRRTPENRSQTSSGNKVSHVNAALLKKPHNYDMLCSELEDIQEVMECLLQKEIITKKESSEVISIERRGLRVAKLLEILFTRPTGQWEEKFLEILEVTGQSHVINRLRKRTPPNSPSVIRPLRNTDYIQRVMLTEEDAEDAIIRKYSVERVQAARDILESDVLSIYKGSILFILDPSSEKAIEELWERHAGSKKIREFLSMILKDYEFKEKFNRKRIVRVELTEEPNEFHCRVKKSSCKFQDYILDISPKDCSECFRRTVVECYQNLLDEIETKMIQKTFHGKDSIVPDFIKIACIDEKEKRSRIERAEIFLQFILGHEQLLMDFKTIFNEMSKFSLPQVPCEAHGGDQMVKCHLREKKVFHFEIYFDRSENTMIVNSISSRIDSPMKFATEDDLSCQKVQQYMLKLVEADSGDIPGNGCLACQCDKPDMIKTSLQRWICGFTSKVHTDDLKMDFQRLGAIRDVRHRILHSPLSVSAEDLQVYQENYRLTLDDLGANNSKWIAVNELADITKDRLTNFFMEFIIGCDDEWKMDNILRCLQDTMHSTRLDEGMKELDETRIVLIGDSIGKTVIANQLLNNCNLSGNGSEKEPKRGTYNDLYFKKKIVVTSAPELEFDSRETMDVIKQIRKAMLMTAPGPHAFIIVVQTSQEDVMQLNEMVQSIMHYFGESTLQYTMVTAIGDVQTYRKFMKKFKSSPNIQDIVQKGRVVFMKDEKLNGCNRNILVESVLHIIEQTAKTMGQDHFTSTTYEKAEELVMRKTHDLCKIYQEEYRRHEKAKASLKARMTPHQILMKRIKDSNLREDVIQNVDEFDVEIDF